MKLFWRCFELMIIMSAAHALPRTKDSDWLETALDALEKAVDFFSNNYDRIILDGIYGLRVAEGQLLEALHYYETRKVPWEVAVQKERVRVLALRAHQAAENAMPYMEQANSEYFNIFLDTIQGPYMTEYIPRRNTPMFHRQKTRSTDYRETEGDACFAELIGHTPMKLNESLQTDSGRSSSQPERCSVTPKCRKMMTTDGKSAYAITHQLLFFIEAQHLKCYNTISEILGDGDLGQFQQYICDRIYTEARLISMSGNVQETMQDLFLEQGVVCAMIGFESFLRPDWLKMIIHWQSPSGCFADQSGNIRKFLQRKSRKLLIEKELEDGCLSHKTGLGTGLLGVYVRYLIQNQGQFESIAELLTNDMWWDQ